MNKCKNVMVGFLAILNFLITFSAVSSEKPQVSIPVKVENNRFFVNLNAKGVAAELLVDSGGRTGIYPDFLWYWKNEDHPYKFGQLSVPSDIEKKEIPLDQENYGYFRVLGTEDEITMIRKVLHDGILGHLWLGKRSWIFDYKKKTLTMISKMTKPDGVKVDLFFKGENFFYPRITVKIDEDDLQMLLDTGGTSFLSTEAMQTLDVRDPFQGSSFIRESIYEKWRKAHPNWRVIESGDRMGNQPMIEVPNVIIAGTKIGPVWFARRSNSAYDDMMAQLMDCKCAGAIGGNILSKFKLTLDYQKKTAWLKRSY